MKFKNILIYLSFLSLSVTAMAKGFDHQYISYQQVLKKIYKLKNKQALINYELIRRGPKNLNSIASSFSALSKKEYKTFSKDQKLAFLINAYNIFTIQLIIKHYPVKSIKDIGSLFTSAWKKKFFTLFGEKMHLDHIENKLIRKEFNEPRIHFAIVCASMSCPNLREKPFTAGQLHMQLEESSRSFLNDPSKNAFNPKDKSIKLSKIFKWYGSDFDKKYGSYLNFIATRITNDSKAAAQIQKKLYKLSWEKYDWKLNKW